MRAYLSPDNKSATKTYFGSRLFRGLPEEKQKPLRSLTLLNEIKQNPRTLKIDYDDLKPQKIKVQSQSTKQIKKIIFQDKKSRNSSEYQSLDPMTLKQSLPKRPNTNLIPSEQRQILIDHYTSQAEAQAAENSYQTLELLWQHTLTNPANTSGHDIVISRNASMMNLNNERSTFKRKSVDVEDSESDIKIDNFFKKGTGPENSYTVLYENINFFTNSLKDFHKIVSYSRLYHEKAVAQESHLFNFISTFAREVDEIEKLPTREHSDKRLKLCISSIENKIGELTSENELINEQITQLSTLINSRYDIFDDIGLRIENPASNNLNIPSHQEIGDESQYGLKLSLNKISGVGEGDPGSLIEKLRQKTEMLKADVYTLQAERQEFENAPLRQSSAKLQNKFKQSIDMTGKFLETDPDEINEDGSPVFSTKRTNERHSADQASHERGVHFDLSNGFDKINEEEEDEDIEIISNQLKSRQVSEMRHYQAPQNFLTSQELANQYQITLETLENKVAKTLKEAKLFQKEFDEISVSQNNKLLYLQINHCFETILAEFQKMFGEFTEKRIAFLKEAQSYFNSLKELNESNLLKLNSVKVVMVESFNKLYDLKSFCKKYTQYDLTDQDLRKEYDARYNFKKSELSKDRKTLIFLSKQFDNPVPLSKLKSFIHPFPDDLIVLVERAKMFGRVLIYLQKFPQLEYEFNEKSYKAYSTFRNAGHLVESLTEFFDSRALLSAELFKDGEDIVKNLSNLNLKVTALKNEIEICSKIPIFSTFVKRPLEITIKLIKKMEINEKELKNILGRIRESIINEYVSLVKKCDEVETNFNSHIKRLLTTNQHLDFSLWKNNYDFVETLKEEMAELFIEMQQFINEKYPPSIVLVPKPAEKRDQIKSFEQRAECVMKTISIGKLLESETFFQNFQNLNHLNIKQHISPIFEKIKGYILEQEKILIMIEKDSEQVKRMANDAMNILLQMRLVLKKTLEIDEIISKEFSSFEEETVRYDLEDFRDVARWEERTASITFFGEDNQMDNQYMSTKKVNTKTLTNVVEDYPTRLAQFIIVAKNVYRTFFDDVLKPSTQTHKIFTDIERLLFQISAQELEILDRIQKAMSNIQMNLKFYNKEIKPISKLYKYWQLMSKWNEKLISLRIAKEKMEPCLVTIKRYEMLTNMRGGIELQVSKFCKNQEKILNSVDLITDLFQLGSFINEKDIRNNLNNQLRIEKGNIEGFVVIVLKKMNEIKAKAEQKAENLQEETQFLINDLEDFLDNYLAILELSEEKYRLLFLRVTDGLAAHDGDFVVFLEKSYEIMKEYEGEFYKLFTHIQSKMEKNTWITGILDEFWKFTIQKDVEVFRRLVEEGKVIQSFNKEIIENFIQKEVLLERKYKTLSFHDSKECDKRADKCTESIQILNSFLSSEEVISRPELKNVIQEKLRHITALKRILSTFSIIYTMNKKMNEYLTPILMSKSPAALVDLTDKMDSVATENVKQLSKIIEESKGISKIEFQMDFNLERILKEDILAFVMELRSWLKNLRDASLGISEFYGELKRKFKNQVIFLRDDWVNFIKEWMSKYFNPLGTKIMPIKANYPDAKDRIKAFLTKLDSEVVKDRTAYLFAAEKVECLNKSFFSEWFFNSTEERDFGDKILPAILKFMRELKTENFSADKLRIKLYKIYDNLNMYLKCYKDLLESGLVERVFEGISKWEHVEAYHSKHSFKTWADVLNAGLEKLISEESRSGECPPHLETFEKLSYYLQNEKGFVVTRIQQDFIEALFEWTKRQNAS